MSWNEKTGSLDFTSLRACYISGALQPEDVIQAVYRGKVTTLAKAFLFIRVLISPPRIATRGEDHVWIYLVPCEEALAAARKVASTIPKSAPLFGIPCAIKDNIDVPGLPSPSAFPPSRQIAINTGTAVQRLLEAGAIVIGKTNMDQLAIGLVQYKGGATIGDNHVRLPLDELGGSFCDALGAPFRPVIFDRDSAVLDPPEFAQSLRKAYDPHIPGRWAVPENGDASQLIGFLRSHCKRIGDCRAAEQRNKLAPSHCLPQGSG